MTNNLTVGSPTRVIVAFTLPLLIGNLFQQVYQFTDAAVVASYFAEAANEKAEAETRQVKAGAAEATDKAIRAIVKAAASFDDDETARDYIVSFDITDQLSDSTIDALVVARHSFGGAAETADPFLVEDDPAFAAARLKKKA